jgi:hypothetical protein|tara:strand:+ start:400 stop:579 length:180 start_codon:yes stop_codon:yes gene_type:complete
MNGLKKIFEAFKRIDCATEETQMLAESLSQKVKSHHYTAIKKDMKQVECQLQKLRPDSV